MLLSALAVSSRLSRSRLYARRGDPVKGSQPCCPTTNPGLSMTCMAKPGFVAGGAAQLASEKRLATSSQLTTFHHASM
jgi:hypothetical protein